jgi:hypothetical protein
MVVIGENMLEINDRGWRGGCQAAATNIFILAQMHTAEYLKRWRTTLLF